MFTIEISALHFLHDLLATNAWKKYYNNCVDKLFIKTVYYLQAYNLEFRQIFCYNDKSSLFQSLFFFNYL